MILIRMDEILLLLLKFGAHRKPVKLTTTELGSEVKMSQQTASRRLRELEKEGYITREAGNIRLTKKAYEELAEEYSLLKQIFDAKLEISGTVVKGIGEGSYYMGLDGYKKQIREKLGFSPHPGTLNIKLGKEDRWKREQLLAIEPIVISGFTDRERTYGNIYAYPCRLEGKGCAMIFPLRTSHGPQIVEIICPFDIRKRLGKKDGDSIRVMF